MIWTFLYWVLLSLAILVGLRALFWDRAGFRGRAKLRCRKCWYDLTASPGDLREEPIVCPECGKKHASRRAMRKTRRSKKWVAVALVLTMGAYAAGVWPRVSAYNYSNGVLGAVPTPVLILALPILPDEQGTVIDRGGTPYRKRPMADRIAHQLMIRLYKSEETSRLDHWLFAKFAQNETGELLTDKTTVRGQVYSYVYNAWARQQRMTHEEEHWARSVYYLDLETRDAMPQMAPVHARAVAFRRLVDDRRVRVRIHERVYIPKSIGAPTFVRRLVPVDLQPRERWVETVRLRDYVRWANHLSSSTSQTIAVEGMIYEGDPYADIWWPVGEINQYVSIEIAQMIGPYKDSEIREYKGIRLVEDFDAVDAWVKEAVRIEFKWKNGFPRDGDIPIGFYVRVDDSLLNETTLEAFTFGGRPVLVIKIKGQDDVEHLAIGDPSWWALRDQRDADGNRIFDGDDQWIAFDLSESDLFSGYVPMGEDDTIESAWIEIHPNGDVVGGGNYAPLWDLDATRIYPRVIKIPMSERDVRRLELAAWALIEAMY